MERYGDTPEGMVASAVEYSRRCREASGSDPVVVSLKSSNVRVMVQAYRLLAAAMRRDGAATTRSTWASPRRATTAEGRVKSAVGIGALLGRRSSATRSASRSPRRPSAKFPSPGTLAGYFAAREGPRADPRCGRVAVQPRTNTAAACSEPRRTASEATFRPVICKRDTRGGPLRGYSRPAYADIRFRRGCARRTGRAAHDRRTSTAWPSSGRSLKMIEKGKTNPVVIRRTYDERDAEALQVKAAADLGPLLLDGFGDGIWIENRNGAVAQDEIDATSLAILQAARVRVSKAEYIACPSCGRTLYDIERTLSAIKARTSHLRGIRIGVMGCIVNGPGEMADADYGYVGSGPGRITLYKGREIMERNIPQERALDALVELIRRCGDWREPDTV